MMGTAALDVALSLSSDKAAGLREVYTVLGVLLMVTVPLAFLIPDAARERRQRSVAAEPKVVQSERTTASQASPRNSRMS